MGPETARWGGGLPLEGVVAENFVPALETLSSLGFEERNPGCPGNFAGMSRTPGGVQKVCAKKLRAHFSFPICRRAALIRWATSPDSYHCQFRTPTPHPPPKLLNSTGADGRPPNEDPSKSGLRVSFLGAHQRGRATTRLLRRVLRRVLKTAFEKVLKGVLRRCLVVGFRGRRGSEKGS